MPAFHLRPAHGAGHAAAADLRGRRSRATDAAALAGAVYLPGNVTTAVSSARAEASKNGYTHGTNATVTPTQDAVNNRQLDVTISTDVGTFFLHVIGISTINATRTAKAEYVLPVPMGSPENYYGVYGLVRTDGGGKTTYANGDTGWVSLGTTKGTNAWGTPDNVYASDDARATSATNNQAQQWGFTTGISFPANLSSIRGVEVAVEARTTGGTSCQVRTDVSWNNGSTWTTGTGVKTVPATGLTTTDPAAPYYAMGGATDLWNRSSWASSGFSASNFRIRLTNLKPFSCTGTAQVDYIRIKVHYQTSTFVPDENLAGPQGQALTPRGFWAEMLSQGAETIQGDAYLPFYDTRTSASNAKYNQQQYYNYAVEMAPGSTGGSVWLYDPGFCAGDLQLGLGDNWVSGNNPVSAFYDLYDTQDTPYNLNDDTLVASSGNTFRRSSGKDADLTAADDGSGPTGCDAYHLAWYQLASGLSGGSGGRIYRLHTSTVDPGSANDQKSTDARNGFAIFVSASGGTRSPRVYGIGPMEMYTPLPGGQSSEFYLAQIDPVHAGKTMEIRLWDAGDTNQNANIQILAPTSGGWSAATLDYTAARGTANGNATACNSTAGTDVTSIVTYSSGASRFNGCWLTITIPIPSTYTAPQDGWWKIRYNMTGSSTATDITTWEVSIRGNPVHLKVP